MTVDKKTQDILTFLVMEYESQERKTAFDLCPILHTLVLVEKFFKKEKVLHLLISKDLLSCLEQLKEFTKKKKGITKGLDRLIALVTSNQGEINEQQINQYNKIIPSIVDFIVSYYTPEKGKRFDDIVVNTCKEHKTITYAKAKKATVLIEVFKETYQLAIDLYLRWLQLPIEQQMSVQGFNELVKDKYYLDISHIKGLKKYVTLVYKKKSIVTSSTLDELYHSFNQYRNTELSLAYGVANMLLRVDHCNGEKKEVITKTVIPATKEDVEITYYQKCCYLNSFTTYENKLLTLVRPVDSKRVLAFTEDCIYYHIDSKLVLAACNLSLHTFLVNNTIEKVELQKGYAYLDVATQKMVLVLGFDQTSVTYKRLSYIKDVPRKPKVVSRRLWDKLDKLPVFKVIPPKKKETKLYGVKLTIHEPIGTKAINTTIAGKKNTYRKTAIPYDLAIRKVTN